MTITADNFWNTETTIERVKFNPTVTITIPTNEPTRVDPLTVLNKKVQSQVTILHENGVSSAEYDRDVVLSKLQSIFPLGYTAKTEKLRWESDPLTIDLTLSRLEITFKGTVKSQSKVKRKMLGNAEKLYAQDETGDDHHSFFDNLEYKNIQVLIINGIILKSNTIKLQVQSDTLALSNQNRDTVKRKLTSQVKERTHYYGNAITMQLPVKARDHIWANLLKKDNGFASITVTSNGSILLTLQGTTIVDRVVGKLSSSIRSNYMMIDRTDLVLSDLFINNKIVTHSDKPSRLSDIKIADSLESRICKRYGNEWTYNTVGNTLSIKVYNTVITLCELVKVSEKTVFHPELVERVSIGDCYLDLAQIKRQVNTISLAVNKDHGSINNKSVNGDRRTCHSLVLKLIKSQGISIDLPVAKMIADEVVNDLLIKQFGDVKLVKYALLDITKNPEAEDAKLLGKKLHKLAYKP